MDKRYWLLIGALGLFIFMIFQNQNPERDDVSMVSDRAVQEELPQSQVTREKFQAEEERPVTANTRSERLITDEEVKNLRRSLPETSDVRKEVEKNPHQTPDSLMKFGKTLGTLFEKARKNPQDADLLMKELGDCVSQDNVIVSARTVCLNKADQLSQLYPALKNDAVEMRKNAKQDVKDLSNKMDSYFIKKQ